MVLRNSRRNWEELCSSDGLLSSYNKLNPEPAEDADIIDPNSPPVRISAYTGYKSWSTFARWGWNFRIDFPDWKLSYERGPSTGDKDGFGDSVNDDQIQLKKLEVDPRSIFPVAKMNEDKTAVDRDLMTPENRPIFDTYKYRIGTRAVLDVDKFPDIKVEVVDQCADEVRGLLTLHGTTNLITCKREDTQDSYHVECPINLSSFNIKRYGAGRMLHLDDRVDVHVDISKDLTSLLHYLKDPLKFPTTGSDDFETISQRFQAERPRPQRSHNEIMAPGGLLKRNWLMLAVSSEK